MMPLWITATRPLRVDDRVGVALGRLAVRRPARVGDAVAAAERLARQLLDQAVELAFGAPGLETAVLDHRDAGRVVAAVLEAPQSVDEQRNDLAGSDVADDSAHGPGWRSCRARVTPGVGPCARR